ncbi:MAG: fimbrillin family protein, partial [Rikenellaceae bacterium]
MASCSLSTVEFDDELDVESSFVSGSEVAFDAIQSSDVSTRTEIGDDMTTTMWSPDDKIYLWAYDGTTAAVSGQEFSLKYYGSNYDEALFIGSVDEMDEDVQYRYYAVYPEPVSVSGDNVTYNISSVQSGKYDENSCDIMVAGAVVSDAFKLGEKSDLELPFRHLLHAIRVVVPEGRNFLGDSISQLEITFPSNVVGDVSFAITGLDANGDALTDLPQTTFTNATNVLNVEFDQAIAEETYIWMFIYPQTINGEIRFKAFDESGRQSQYIYATLSNRSMEAGKVTPIDLTIPEELERTILKLNLTANNLGEDPTTLTFTAPDETLYRNGKNEVSQSYELNGEYSLSYYTDLYGPLFENTGIVITYDSPNALVQNTLTLTNLVANETNYYDISVPYLLDEDFSGVSSSFEYYTDPGGSVSSST